MVTTKTREASRMGFEDNTAPLGLSPWANSAIRKFAFPRQELALMNGPPHSGRRATVKCIPQKLSARCSFLIFHVEFVHHFLYVRHLFRQLFHGCPLCLRGHIALERHDAVIHVISDIVF